MKKGGWVFISHSHQDIELVRKIRNHLEVLGLEPLMFYLKCLSDEDEIEDLIKREINERDWFIYADSENARASKWVRTEREYIEKLTGKNIFTIDLKENLEEQMRRIEHISRQMKVFISYARRDQCLQNCIKEKLVARDMLVLNDEAQLSGLMQWDQAICEAVDNASRNGFVLLLLTEASVGAEFVKYEVQKTLEQGGKIVPVYVGKAKLSEDLLPMIGDIQGVSISEEPTEAELDKILDHILHRVEYYHRDFRDSASYRSARNIHLPAISRIDSLTFFDCDNLECVYIPDSVIYITPDAFEDHPDILVRCSGGSYAEQFCIRHGIRYELT